VTESAWSHLLDYARVSTVDQQPHLQVDAPTATGCHRVFTETASDARTDRPPSGISAVITCAQMF
jgi:hypothetical protein